MNKLQSVITAVVLLASGTALTEAHASQVLTIPYSAAEASADAPDSCWNLIPDHWEGEGIGCDLAFPLNIPAGHVIHQISILRSTDNAFPAPGLSAEMIALNLQSAASQERFTWITNDSVPAGAIDNHRLMAQTKFGYPDEFTVDPNTSYQVLIFMTQGANVYGLQVTYD